MVEFPDVAVEGRRVPTYVLRIWMSLSSKAEEIVSLVNLTNVRSIPLISFSSLSSAFLLSRGESVSSKWTLDRGLFTLLPVAVKDGQQLYHMHE